MKSTTAMKVSSLFGAAMLLLVCAPAMAQQYLFGNAAFATGGRPLHVMADDFNHDAIIDLAVVSQCSNDPSCSVGGVSVLLGNPDGTFQPYIEYPTGNLPKFGIVADFNADANPDIVVLNTNADTISVLLGKGDGTFHPPVDYSTSQNPNSGVAGDFNNDGKLDLAIANAGSKSVSLFLGNGDGSFQSPLDSAVGFPPVSITAADFNKDGKLDLAVADSNVSVLLGNGDGTFRPPAEYPGNGAIYLVSADVNGDGNLDLISAGFTNSVSVLLGSGSGTFITPALLYPVAGGPVSIVAADLNGDHQIDLGVGTAGSNTTISILLNKGDGTFHSHLDFGGMSALSVAAADFNGDGKPDLAAPNIDFATVNILLGDGSGKFGSISDVLTGTVSPAQVVSGDFNNDGRLDLGLAMQGSGSVAVALGKATGGFDTPIVNYGPGATPSITTGDFNGDGNLDIAAFVYSQLNNIHVLLGNGDGTFRTRITFAVPNTPGKLAAGDFNNDGKVDLVAVGFGFHVMLGNGDGTFQQPLSSPSFPRTMSDPVVADFNKDGMLDLAVASSDYTCITVFMGIGNGNFKPGVDYPTGETANWPRGLMAADFDGDGQIDLAVATSGTTVSLFRGNGDGTFKKQIDSATVPTAMTLQSGDFNGDGKLDLMVAGNGVLLLPGKGDGTFSTGFAYYSSSSSIASAVTADFDGDNRLDVAVANPWAGSASVILNRSAVALRPIQLSFSHQLVGTQGSSQTLTVYNPGIVPLNISSIEAGRPFSQSNTCGTIVAPGAHCAIAVIFSPTTTGERSAQLTIVDDAIGTPQSVPLSGTGTDFSVEAATGANCPPAGNCSTSATINAGQVATYNLQVSSISGFTGPVALACMAGSLPMTCSVSPTSLSAEPSSESFTVTVSNTSAALSTGPVGRPYLPTFSLASGIPIVFALALMFVVTPVRVAHGHIRVRRAWGLAVLLLSIAIVSSCGGGEGRGTQPPSSVTLTVTGTSSSVSHSLPLVLTIRH